MATITCKIPEDLNAQLESIARHRRVSKSVVLREALESKIKSTRKGKTPMAYDLSKHLCGKLRGPSDLATNPKHMKGFGE